MGLIDCASGNSIWRGYDYFKEKKVSKLAPRAGRYYGFIQAFPDNMFFHSEDNPQIDFTRILGKTVGF